MKPYKCKKVHKVQNYASSKAEFVVFVRQTRFREFVNKCSVEIRKVACFMLLFFCQNQTAETSFSFPKFLETGKSE